MKTLRQALAAALALLVSVPPSFAASLYSGAARTGPAPAAPAAASVPRLPTASTLGFEVGANMVPGALAPTAIPAAPAAGAKAETAAKAATAAAAPTAPARAKPAAEPAAAPAAAEKTAPRTRRSAEASALGQARAAGDGVAASEAKGSDAGASLTAAFDNAATRASSGGSDAPPVAAAAGVDDFVARAARLFHPALGGQAPAVAARTVPAPTVEGALPSDADMQARMQLSPLTNPEREATVIKLFQAGGAAANVVDVPRGKAPDLSLDGVIQRQDAGRGRHNYIVVKKGQSDRIVVVGGHHDKVSEGAGTIDNWTGATMVTNLHQAMHGEDTDATFVFVAFAREEEGLLGSEAFLRSLTAQQKDRIDSMVNLDTLGVDGTFSWKNNSSRSLLDLVQKVAAKEKYDLVEAYLDGGDADSSTFLHAGIAAMTIFGASQDVIFDIIHTAADTIAAFSLPHYRNAYRLTLALLKALDAKPVKPAAAVI